LGALTALVNVAGSDFLSAVIHFGPVLSGLPSSGGMMTRIRALQTASANSTRWEVVMSHLILTGDNITYPGIGSLGESSSTITISDTGTNGLFINSLELIGPPSVSIVSEGGAGGSNHLLQLVDGTVLTAVTISGSEPFFLGSATGNSLTGDGVVPGIRVE
jgi:hypothetical protein